MLRDENVTLHTTLGRNDWAEDRRQRSRGAGTVKYAGLVFRGQQMCDARSCGGNKHNSWLCDVSCSDAGNHWHHTHTLQHNYLTLPASLEKWSKWNRTFVIIRTNQASLGRRIVRVGSACGLTLLLPLNVVTHSIRIKISWLEKRVGMSTSKW